MPGFMELLPWILRGVAFNPTRLEHADKGNAFGRS